MKFKKRKKKIEKKIRKYFSKIQKKIKKQTKRKEYNIMIFFGILFGIIALRLVVLQVIQGRKYDKEITNIHYKESLLKAKRGDIYIYDKGGRAVSVTRDITLYDLYLEPQYFAHKNTKGENKGKIANPSAIPRNKEKFIELITPHLYKHFCVQYGTQSVTKEQCVRNIESFTKKEILPKEKLFFYSGSGTILNESGNKANEEYEAYSKTGHQKEYQGILTERTEENAQKMIQEALQEKIVIGEKETNYLGFFTDQDLLEEIKRISYIKVYGKYVYIVPKKITNTKKAKKELINIFNRYQQKSLIEGIEKKLQVRESQYIKIATNIHPSIATNIKNIKKTYTDIFYQCQPTGIKKNEQKIQQLGEAIMKYPESSNQKKRKNEKQSVSNKIKECETKKEMLGDTMYVPFLHGLGLTPHDVRYYPFNSFLAHTIGMVNSKGKALYGVEEYMDDELRGKDGKIIGRSSATIGAIGANDFNVEKPTNGKDVYLTIDQNIQKYIEKILPNRHRVYNADSISVVVMEPKTGKIRAMANYPNYNPNNTNSAFRYVPLSPEKARITDQKHYIDVHLFVKEKDGSMKKATTAERADPTIPKRIAENIYGSEVFVDKNIKYPYEPGSVFKPLTAAIGIDSDEISLYDTYIDKGEAIIKDEKGRQLYKIENVSQQCEGNKSYLNALIFSCNVGMIKIIQEIGKPIFYNYTKKLGFGEKTNVELAGEQEGRVRSANTVSFSRFLNNSFGLGLEATPMQLAQGFSSLLNGGEIIKPTVIDKVYDHNSNEFVLNETQIIRRVFTEETAQKIQNALVDVVEGNPSIKANAYLKGFTLGGKTGTAEITYKGIYKGGDGWTNASFIGAVTKENPKYIIVVQVRRPRWKRWGTYTAAPIFRDIAQFLIGYDLIQK